MFIFNVLHWLKPDVHFTFGAVVGFVLFWLIDKFFWPWMQELLRERRTCHRLRRDALEAIGSFLSEAKHLVSPDQQSPAMKGNLIGTFYKNIDVPQWPNMMDRVRERRNQLGASGEFLFSTCQEIIAIPKGDATVEQILVAVSSAYRHIEVAASRQLSDRDNEQLNRAVGERERKRGAQLIEEFINSSMVRSRIAQEELKHIEHIQAR